MSVQLLDKTRKINKLLHNNNSQKVVFNDICQVLMEVMDSNVIVISKKGKILGIQNSENIDPIEEMISGKIGDYIDTDLNERLLTILSTKENVNLQTLGFESDIHRYRGIISPMILRERDLAHCLCTGWKMTIRSMISYWLNMEPQSLVWR